MKSIPTQAEFAKAQQEVATPGEICKFYRDALREVYGDAIADKSAVYYHYGWYYVDVARKFPDGSVGVGGTLPSGHRRKEMVLMIIELQKRADDAMNRK